MDTSEELLNLTIDCTVRIEGMSLGTGFFVAPGWVLTCAHVVEGRTGPINIVWQDQPLAATISIFRREILKIGVEVSWPDIALLKTDDVEHPCVLLRPEAAIGDPLYAYGYTDEYQNGDPITGEIEGWSGKPPFLKFKQGQVRPGLSGAPLFNRRSGAICGMVCRSRGAGSDLGGRAVPVATILEELAEILAQMKAFHLRNDRWLALLSPEQQRAMLPSEPIHLPKLPSGRQALPALNSLMLSHLGAAPFGAWTLLGPEGGFIRTLAVDFQKPEVLYAGMDNDQGLYRTIDSGRTWLPATRRLGDLHVNRILCLPYEHRILAGTDSGLWESNDSGNTWHRGHLRFASKDVQFVGISPVDSDLLLCGTRAKGGITFSVVTVATAGPQADAEAGHTHFSVDGGKTWLTHKIKTTNHADFSHLSSNLAYVVSADQGLFRTKDRFASLDPVPLPDDVKPLCVAICPSDNQFLVLGTLASGLYLTRSAGSDWTRADGIGPVQVSDIKFLSKTGQQIAVATTEGFYESQDGGKSWHPSGDMAAYRWAMTLAHSSDGSLYMGTSGGGVYKRKTAQENWLAVNRGLPSAPCLRVVCSSGKIIVGSGIGVYRSQDEGTSWDRLGLDAQGVFSLFLKRPDVNPGPVIAGGDSLSISRNAGETFYTAGVPADQKRAILVGTQSGAIYQSDDEGESWRLVARLDGKIRSLVSVEVPQHLFYAAVDGSGLHSSSDGGASWKPTGQLELGPAVNSLTLVPHLGNRLFAATADRGLYFLQDGAWVPAEGPPAVPITSVAAAGGSVGSVYVSTIDGTVHKSTDGGQIFIETGKVDLPKSNRWSTLAVSPANVDRVYLGTAFGLYVSQDGGCSWDGVDGGLLGSEYHVSDLAVSHAGSSDRILAATSLGLLRANLPV